MLIGTDKSSPRNSVQRLQLDTVDFEYIYNGSHCSKLVCTKKTKSTLASASATSSVTQKNDIILLIPQNVFYQERRYFRSTYED